MTATTDHLAKMQAAAATLRQVADAKALQLNRRYGTGPVAAMPGQSTFRDGEADALADMAEALVALLTPAVVRSAAPPYWAAVNAEAQAIDAGHGPDMARLAAEGGFIDTTPNADALPERRGGKPGQTRVMGADGPEWRYAAPGADTADPNKTVYVGITPEGGMIRLELWPEGYALWHHGEVVWRSGPHPSPVAQQAIEAGKRLNAAAPALLKELKHLVGLLEPLERSGGFGVPGLATLNGARAAIAKAEGRS